MKRKNCKVGMVVQVKDDSGWWPGERVTIVQVPRYTNPRVLIMHIDADGAQQLWINASALKKVRKSHMTPESYKPGTLVRVKKSAYMYGGEVGLIIRCESVSIDEDRRVLVYLDRTGHMFWFSPRDLKRQQ